MCSECERARGTSSSSQALMMHRIDGLIPNTPTGRKSAIKKKETPVSRVKSEHVGSSPDHKSPGSLKDQLDSMGSLP